MFVGLNGEVTWRSGSVLVAQSNNFPSQTYWSTIERSVDLSASLRLGISF